MRSLTFTSLSAKVTAAVVATVLLIGGGSFWVLQGFYRQQMVDSLAASTTVQGELIEVFGDLHEGETVVRRGNDEIRPGSKITANAAKR